MSNSLEDIAKELIEMAKVDQEVRLNYQSGKSKFDSNTDLNNTLRLKKIVEKIGWPTISMVGKEASNAAWLLVQHADHDPEFQNKCLDLMLKAKPGDINSQNIAYLTDRIAVNTGKKQTYGTQFYGNKPSELKPRPIKDIKNLNRRRKKIGLEPFEVYSQKMRGEYDWGKKEN